MPEHREKHSIGNVGWLRAAVLGANDGIVSTSSLILGVAAAHSTHNNILVTGIAGLVAGAMSMATGEYVSVHSQVDTEKSAINQERMELLADYPSEVNELVGIYVARGVEPVLAKQVAGQLMAFDALGAHARDELGISEALKARPLQAALASAASFAAGSLLPLSVVAIVPEPYVIPSVSAASLIFLALLGAAAAKTGSANMFQGLVRVTFWSALAMGVTVAVGALVGTLI